MSISRSLPLSLTRHSFSSLAALIVIAGLDYITGYELQFFVFYFIPIALLASRVSQGSAVVGACVCAFVWYAVDHLSGHSYTSAFYPLWNALLRLSAFLIIAVALARMRLHRERMMEANVELANSLVRLERMNEELQRLREGLHVVCAWTKRIKVDGQWLSLETFLDHHLKMKLTHGISDEALKDFFSKGTEPTQ